MNIRVPIPVKMVITSSSKTEKFDDIQFKMNQIHKELEQLQFQQKKLFINVKKKGIEAINEVQQRMDYEFKRRQEMLEVLTEQYKQWEKLEEGDEIYYSTVEAEIDIEVGFSWEDIQRQEIVIRDGVIIEIRGGYLNGNPIY
ncbi:YlqD family protein [Tepidibacillus marianensis]|uniref:YlqD family protein n=1 Tax=Tepidibacillus marianensis TaxID=3131995 RepID=UPI0030CF6BBA